MDTEVKLSFWARWRKRLRDQYRLVIMNHETFEEVGSYRLTLLNVYVALSSILVLGALIAGLLIIFTPLRQLVPGYGKAKNYAELKRMEDQIDELESNLTAQIGITDALRRTLQEKPVTEDDIPPAVDIKAADSLELIPASEAELALRQDVAAAQRNLVDSDHDIAVNLPSKRRNPNELLFVPPVEGKISSGFLSTPKHFGVDINAPKNTPVKATLDGFVFMSDWTLDTGNTIGIRHDDDLISFYKHNSALLKKAGDFVRAGEAVAIIGNTGTLSSGTHLHFEIWYQGQPINPADWIDFKEL